MADFMTDFVADCVTDFCIFLSFKSVGKSFGVTYHALGYSVFFFPYICVIHIECFMFTSGTLSVQPPTFPVTVSLN